jgi:membrane protein YdbS with pleckstrin-like domain
MFERRHQKIAPAPVFMRRLIGYIGIAILVILAALFIGVAGYHWVAGLGWVDSLLNASMILGGMGPVNPLVNTGAKVFASAYALFSGLVFIAVMGIVLSPIVHRMLHRFHVDDQDLQKRSDK